MLTFTHDSPQRFYQQGSQMTYKTILNKQAAKRKEIALSRANKALDMMREKGIAVELFGSITTDRFMKHSDVDFLITECPDELRYAIESYVEDIMLDIPFDVAYYDELSDRFKERLKSTDTYERPNSKNTMVHPVFIDTEITFDQIVLEIQNLEGALCLQDIPKWVFETACSKTVDRIYTSIEKIFTRLASHIDEDVPSESSWGSTLLNRMSSELPGVRPSVISRETLDVLNELHSFRHNCRNNYATNNDRLMEIIGKTINIVSVVKNEIELFKVNLEAYLQ